jgi:hypothetical protein
VYALPGRILFGFGHWFNQLLRSCRQQAYCVGRLRHGVAEIRVFGQKSFPLFF